MKTMKIFNPLNLNPANALIIAFAFFLQLNFVAAQSHSCGVTHELEKYQTLYPEEYEKRLAEYNGFISKSVLKVQQLKNSGVQQTCPNGITVLPIAFHIFHSGEAIGTGRNFSRDDLRLVVDQLNSDFSGYSDRKENITGDFQSFESGHTCIQFAIGKINRINTATCPSYRTGATHGTLHACLPGGSGVGSENDPHDYLNIYVTDLDNGFLGIASSIPKLFGRANSDDDGVTINHEIVIPGRAGSLYNRGSVLAHEIGHWLGLPHVNGDINGSGCGADDGFNDTYPQNAQRFYLCSAQEIPTSCGSVDNIFNFMDYSADCAKLMFTEEQAMTMREVLQSDRRQLASSFARGNDDTEEFNTTCKTFEANSRNFEFIVADCHTEMNFLDYQTRWYPSEYNSDNSTSGLTIFTWELDNRTKSDEVLQKQELYMLPVVHQAQSFTDVRAFNLFIQCWDPYKRQYTEKVAAGRLMVILKRCPTPENDEVENAIALSFGTDCFEDSYILNSATTSRKEQVACSNNREAEDVWFKTTVPEQAGMKVEARRVNTTEADPIVEAYIKRGSQFICVGDQSSSTLEITDLAPGEELYFRVYNQSSASGTFFICMSQTALSNNTCNTAAALTVENSCNSKVYHNFGATASGYPSNKALCGRTDRALDIWFTAVVPASGNLFVESFEVEGGVSEVIMEAYAGSCNDLTPVACSSIKEYWPVNDRHALIELFNRVPGETIYIRIFGGGTIREGEFGLCAYGGAPQTSCRISYVEALGQSECDGATSTYEQTLRVTFRNSGANEFLFVNNQSFRITRSPQIITLTNLPADGRVVNVSANIGNSSDDLCWQQSHYRAYTLFTAPAPCLSEGIPNDDCLGAIELAVGPTCNEEIHSNVGATYSTAASRFFSCGVSGFQPDDVWFKVRVPSSGNVTVSAPLLFNENNMILEAYSGTCDALTLVDCDQFGGSRGSEINLTDQAAGSYIYYRVVDQGNNTKGDFSICAHDSSVNGFATSQSAPEDSFPEWYYDEASETIVKLEGDAIATEKVIEDSQLLDVVAYPNPTTDYIYVKRNSSEESEIRLIDIMGRSVKSIKTSDSQTKIDVQDLIPGYYTLTVNENNQRTSVKVLVAR